MGSSATIVEHLVIMKAKDESSPSQISTLLNSLKSLRSLDMVIYLSTGPLYRTESAFTHILHTRFHSKDDLAAYAVDPVHIAVSRTIQPICDAVIIVDWVSQNQNGSYPKPGSAMRVQLVKMKEGLGEREKGAVLEVIGGFKETVRNLKEISFGKNLTPEKANGYSICSIAVFDGISEMDAAADDLEIGENDKIRDYIDGVLVVDYVVPSQSDDQI